MGKYMQPLNCFMEFYCAKLSMRNDLFIEIFPFMCFKTKILVELLF